jgi:glutaredoxin/glutathione-dependent peroxiredoxin
MTISNGDTVPDVEVRTFGAKGPEPVRTTDLFGQGRTVLFGVPGAFTPGCDKTHLPGFVAQADELKAKGVDRIACIAVNDAFVMDAWGKSHAVGDKILMLADGNGEFTKAVGLEMDGSKFGLGTRCKRFAAIIDDGKVTRLDVDESGAVDASACGAVLGRL